MQSPIGNGAGLTRNGARQAEYLGRRLAPLAVDRITHGPLSRVAETARVVAKQFEQAPYLFEDEVAGDYVPHLPDRDEVPDACCYGTRSTRRLGAGSLQASATPVCRSSGTRSNVLRRSSSPTTWLTFQLASGGLDFQSIFGCENTDRSSAMSGRATTCDGGADSGRVAHAAWLAWLGASCFGGGALAVDEFPVANRSGQFNLGCNLVVALASRGRRLAGAHAEGDHDLVVGQFDGGVVDFPGDAAVAAEAAD